MGEMNIADGVSPPLTATGKQFEGRSHIRNSL